MVVFVVVKQVDQGMAVLVASTLEKASDYINAHPYDGFIILERTVDKAEW